MGDIVATYHLKVTLREPDGPPAIEDTEPEYTAPTIAQVEDTVSKALEVDGLTANVKAERTDI